MRKPAKTQGKLEAIAASLPKNDKRLRSMMTIAETRWRAAFNCCDRRALRGRSLAGQLWRHWFQSEGF
jgi:hypothetical protein